MNIDTIRIFCDVVLHQSFSRGASVNDVSQSAATQSIHRLERNLGVQLVDRSRRPFILTPEGQICYDGFRTLLESYDTVVSLVQTLNNKECGIIKLGSVYSVGPYDLNNAIRQFLKVFPKTKIQFSQFHTEEIYQEILTSAIDFGVVAYPMATTEITTVPLPPSKMVVVCSPGNPLTQQKYVQLEQLHGIDFIAYERDMVVRKEIDRQLRQLLVSVNVVAEYENIEMLKQAVEIGLGVSILPENAVKDEINLQRLYALPISTPKIEVPVGIIYKQGKVFSQSMTRFISIAGGLPIQEVAPQE
ncbi:MAG: LysR family transcriptional regulator [Planctomycetaceae bacterium]|jgi:DNA-binding transcriptional LysR family regulator|nr:LysR family transcriptional regulator [Planctomycetaceae bacterium]